MATIFFPCLLLYQNISFTVIVQTNFLLTYIILWIDYNTQTVVSAAVILSSWEHILHTDALVKLHVLISIRARYLSDILISLLIYMFEFTFKIFVYVEVIILWVGPLTGFFKFLLLYCIHPWSISIANNLLIPVSKYLYLLRGLLCSQAWLFHILVLNFICLYYSLTFANKADETYSLIVTSYLIMED